MGKPLTGVLTSSGWTDWAEVLGMLGADECLWADLGGIHHGPAPVRLPVGATHLWSWRPNRWIRVRLDGDRVLATVLTQGNGTPDKSVTARISAGVPWGRHSRTAEWDRRVTLVVTEGHTPITFVEIPHRPLSRSEESWS